MPVLILIAVVAVLAGVFLAATGRGGELAYERVDHAPLDLGPVSAPDIAMLRPPTAMWGYNMQVTDEALDLVARAMRDRDVTIAYLQQQLEYRVAADPGPPQVRQPAGNPPASEALQADFDAPQSPEAAKAPGVLVAPLPQRTSQPPATDPSQEAAQPAEATEPSPTLPGSYDVQGPQGAYDTHDWWAEQEEAAREEEARRQAAAQQIGQALPDESGPLESGPLESGPLESGSFVSSASEADPPESSRTGTVPNPVITSAGGTDIPSAHSDPPATISAPLVSPDDDTTAEAEEQGW